MHGSLSYSVVGNLFTWIRHSILRDKEVILVIIILKKSYETVGTVGPKSYTVIRGRLGI